LDEDTLVDSPKPQPIQEKEKRQVVGERLKKPSLEIVIKEQFINKC